MITSYSNTISVTTAGSLLLDDYPNAAAAYSLRKLRGPYIGDAIRVRRASDNTELNIGFVNNELDTASLTTFCSGTDGFVTTWYDQSGNGYDATQATAANQPQIVSSGNVILSNSKPAFNFDGTNDGLLTPLGNTTNFTVFHVAQQLSNQSAYRSFYGGANAFRNVMGQSPTTQLYYMQSTNTLVSTITRNFNQNIYYALFNGSTSELQINNDLFSGSITPSTATDMFIGRSFFGEFINASFQEFILYNSNQSANKNGVLTNINNYY